MVYGTQKWSKLLQNCFLLKFWPQTIDVSSFQVDPTTGYAETSWLSYVGQWELRFWKPYHLYVRFYWNKSQRQIDSRFQKLRLYKNASTHFYGCWNLKFGWPTQFNHLVQAKPVVGSTLKLDTSIACGQNFYKKQFWSSFGHWDSSTLVPKFNHLKT